MGSLMVRYEVKPDRVAENESLVRGVYDELAAAQPDGLRYVTFALEDGVGFVHIASVDTEDGSNPLAGVAAFARFQEGLGDRLVAPPTVTSLRTVGAYRVVGA
jgi:hypothetical protein